MYNLAAQFAGAIGSLAIALPDVLSHVGITAQRQHALSLHPVWFAGRKYGRLLFLRLSPAAELRDTEREDIFWFLR